MNLVDELLRVVACLEAAKIDYAICGGIAVTLHGAVRTTKDLDVLVRPGDAAQVLDLVRPLGFAYVSLPMAFDAGAGTERQLQRVTKLEDGVHLVLDLIMATQSLAFALEDPVRLQLRDGRLSVVSLAALRRMKTLAGRAQDLADLERLAALDGDAK